MDYLKGFKDCGCDEKTCQIYATYLKEGKKEKAIKELSIKRNKLLKDVHKCEERINCIDYLIYEIRKED